LFIARLGQDNEVGQISSLNKKAFSKVFIRATGASRGKLVDNIKQPQISTQITSANSQEATPLPATIKPETELTKSPKEQSQGQTKKPKPMEETGRAYELSAPKLTHRLRNKTRKVMLYWNRFNLMIPNVFKMTMKSEECPGNIVEYNDLSLKGMLVMAGGNQKECEDVSKDGESVSLVNFSEGQEESQQYLSGLMEVSFAEFDYGC